MAHNIDFDGSLAKRDCIASYSIWRLSIAVVSAIWVFHYLSLTIAGSLIMPFAHLHVVRRLLSLIVGIAMSLVIVAIIDRLWDRPVWVKAIAVLALSCLMPIPFGYLNLAIMPQVNPDIPEFRRLVAMWTGFSHLFFAVTIATVTVQFAVELRKRQDRFDRLDSLFREAELKALRYQVNPHFLFNALNSVASLLSSRDVEDAEEMVENLAHYYQRVLAAGPEHEVPLERELEAQESYLAIEKVRFPDRLTVRLDIAAELRNALVPKLILQPLIENVIKHSAARSEGTVMIGIKARSRADILVVETRDCRSSGVVTGKSVVGNGTGLANIEARLHWLYGSSASLDAEEHANGFRVRIELPLRFAS